MSKSAPVAAVQTTDNVTPPTPPAVNEQAFDDAALAAELASLGDEGEPAPTPEPAAEPETPAEEPEADPDADAEPEEEAAEEPEEDAEEDAEPDKAAADPDLAKRLDKIQREERRAKEAVAAERKQLAAEIEAVKKEWEPRIAAAEKFEKMRETAKYDPIGALSALGITEDSYEAVARSLYAASPAGQQNPALRDQAQQTLQQRRYADELAQTRSELKQLKEQTEAKERAAQQQQQVEQYLGSVTKAATDETPLVATMIEKNPSRARTQLAATAERLLKETGEVPDPADVVAELEKARRAELEELGIEPPRPGKKKAAPKTKTPAKAERPVAKSLSSDTEPTTPPRSDEPATDEQLLQELKELREGARTL
jgi:hypothetical protein